MEIKVWKNFSKKHNSTKQPPANQALIKVATIKNPTSIESPTFLLEGHDTDINYVQAFGHYYFVDNITLTANNLSEIECSQDLLATYKSNIGAYNGFVTRSASSYSNWLSDPEVVSSNEVVSASITDGNLLGAYDAGGSYVVRVLGKNGVKNYVMTEGTIQNAFDTFFDLEEISFTDVPAALKSLFYATAEPGQYIKSIKWFPFDCSGSGSEVCYFGFTPTDSAVSIARKQLDTGCTISVPNRYYNDWRDYDSRFVTASVWLPGFGTVSIDPKYLQKTMQCSYFVDIATGDAQIWLLSGGDLIGTYSGSCGVDVQMGGLGGGLGQLTSIGQMFSGVGLNPINFVSGVAGGVSGAVSSSLQPSQSVCGQAGNMSTWITQPFIRVAVSYLGSAGKPTAVEGSPLHQSRTISTLSGFVQCSNASIDIPSLGNDKDAINGMLNSGFYYE